MGRIEPIFGLRTPLLFAHRGGVLEAPESTRKGFDHAIKKARADVLELDVQLTLDGEFVVWHGPEMSNVRIEGQPDIPAERRRNKIYKFAWDELDGKAWVGDPYLKELDDEDIDLSEVTREDGRRLMLFSDFLKKYPEMPLNIEMKDSFKRKIDDGGRNGLKHNLRDFIKILDGDDPARKKVLVSESDSTIDAFRDMTGGRYPTGLSAKEQLVLMLLGRDMKNQALETTHHPAFSGESVIRKVREAGGSTFVFLTAFNIFLPAMDKEVPKDEELFEVLDRGVDGIMTDRPAAVREIMDRWPGNE